MYSKIFNSGKGEHTWENETICELHRQLYDNLFVHLCVTDPQLLEKATVILERAYLCGIKMTKKLVENKCSLPEWEKHESPEDVARLRKLRIELTRKLNEISADIRP